MSEGAELPQPTAWHAADAESALARLEARPSGLSSAEARDRLARYGPNRLPRAKGRGPWARFLVQFHNVLIYVLLAAAGITAGLGHATDTAVILGVVLVNALIGFIQEGKAESALEAIRDMLSPQATVLRDGRQVTLPAESIVPGDVVLLRSGDKAPADLRLIRAKSLRIQESALTGESVPVEKAVAPLAKDTPLAERASMAYSGTLITYGQGAGLVVATGQATEIGQIGAMLGRVQPLTTPLLRQMAVFGRWLTFAILALAGVTFLFGIFLRDYAAGDMFLAAVGLAVAAIPEGLPAVMTITLAIGVQRMARRNAIIRRLPAVETLGSVSVICSDKTGTLTRNEMTVQTVATSREALEVTGSGYAPSGEFLLEGRQVSPEQRPLVAAVVRGGLLCNDAGLRQVDSDWVVAGDPMEGALIVAAVKAGLDPDFESKAWPRIDAIPFESEHRFMATLNHDHEGNAVIHLKGAPERILEMCERQRGPQGDEPLDPDHWRRRMEELAAAGQRVLALAAKRAQPDHGELHFDDMEGGFAMLGLFGLADPPREEATEAVAECRSAGIAVKMITGDHAGTARAIARRIGLGNADDVLTGQDLDELDDDALRRRVGSVDVFARTSPGHKLRLVQALQAHEQVVAMTGDGVNDAPALRRADVGVAMGRKGTEAAKDAAEMVLADDNFASIAHAVEEGRTVYDNLKKSIVFILPTSGGEALIIVAAILLGQLLPITPVQILWVNMITAVTLGLALAFEPPEEDVMRRPPRRSREPILSGFMVWRIAFVSTILLAGTFGLFLWERGQGAELELGRTVAVNTLVAFEAFYLFSTRFLRAPSATWRGLVGSRPVLAAVATVVLFQLLFTYAPPFQALFDTRALDAGAWLRIVLVGATVFLLVEGEKWARRGFDRFRR